MFVVQKVAEKMLAGGMDKQSVVLKLSKDEGRTKVQIQDAIEGKEKWRKALARRGRSEKGVWLQSEVQLPKYLRKDTRAAAKKEVMRAEGGGKKSYVSFLYPGVKQWLDNVRSLGHWVDKGDLVIEFEELAKEWLRRVKQVQTAARTCATTMRMRQAFATVRATAHKGGHQ